MIELGTIRVTNGYYETTTCNESEINEVIEDEKLRKIVIDHCKTRGKDIEILKIVVIKDKNGNIVRIWTIETYYGPFGVMIFADNP